MRTVRHYGKYRGTVLNNDDPLRIGRLQAAVPELKKLDPMAWAMPCLPLAGTNSGLFAVPMVGSGVWIEFERGDLNHPIWVGGFWNSAAEVPVLANSVPPAVSGITLQTASKNGLVISDVPGPAGGILIQAASGAMISIGDSGVTISNGQGAIITLTGPAVDVNGGALTVI